MMNKSMKMMIYANKIYFKSIVSFNQKIQIEKNYHQNNLF